jgi:hypothetical protein
MLIAIRCMGLLLVMLAVGCARRGEPSRAEMARRLEGIQPGEERDMGGGVMMKMLRIQATAPLGDGWHLATSTEGAFSVEMPLPFNDVRMRAQTTDEVEVRTHVVGGKTPGLLAWSASCTVRRDGRLGTTERSPAPERMQLMGSPPSAHARSVEFADMACVLTVEAQGADPLPPEAERLRFLRSLRRTGKPVW